MSSICRAHADSNHIYIWVYMRYIALRQRRRQRLLLLLLLLVVTYFQEMCSSIIVTPIRSMFAFGVVVVTMAVVWVVPFFLSDVPRKGNAPIHAHCYNTQVTNTYEWALELHKCKNNVCFFFCVDDFFSIHSQLRAPKTKTYDTRQRQQQQ